MRVPAIMFVIRRRYKVRNGQTICAGLTRNSASKLSTRRLSGWRAPHAEKSPTYPTRGYWTFLIALTFVANSGAARPKATDCPINFIIYFAQRFYLRQHERNNYSTDDFRDIRHSPLNGKSFLFPTKERLKCIIFGIVKRYVKFTVYLFLVRLIFITL